MRLEPYEIKAIQDSFISNFHSGKIYLFGSRVDDTKKGGDIDLYIEPVETKDLMSKKIRHPELVSGSKIEMLKNLA